jgi:carboxymethylenebutenolidase
MLQLLVAQTIYLNDQQAAGTFRMQRMVAGVQVTRALGGHGHDGMIPTRVKRMPSTKRKLPIEAVELYNEFIHGEISRRSFVEGVQRVAGGLTAATIIDALMPNYAVGQQVSRTDDRIKATYETVPSPLGNGSIKGYLVRPISADTRSETVTKLPGIVVVHENRGLNPHIEDIARRFALANFMAFAPDGLTSLGGFPGDDYKGGQMFNKIDKDKMFEDMVAAALWLKSRPDCTGKIGVTGFCYGGSTANKLAVRLGGDLAAAVPFYGGPPPSEDIPKIKAAVLVHHGELDTRLAATWPAYDQALRSARVPHEGYIYPGAVHGFNCDATPERYNKAAADLAWQRTIAWFNQYLRA